MAKKVIIDCDVGVDDALALILAFHSPELEVLAVSGVNGNVPLEAVFENIQKVLALIRPDHKPLIAKGADRPLKGRALYAHSVHGKTGLGEATLDFKGDETWWSLFPGPADELFTRMARRHPREVTLIAIGPPTNLALAMEKDPEGMKLLREIVLMGGAVRTRGNVTPFAEFNIYSDPVAAQIVFESGIPTTLVPLDVTHQVFLTPEAMEERIRPIGTPFSQFLMEATGYDPKARRFRNRERVFLHDPLAVGVVIDPGLATKEKLRLCVQTEEGEGWGRITEGRQGPELGVCLGVERERFLSLFISRLNP
ncbi:MAG: nucleoside hydrolase [Desulfobacterota bacterium]|nr:nucleoside hydrolase [Thermodesulfobacteriota bacterium]